jgi:hypothetical protein
MARQHWRTTIEAKRDEWRAQARTLLFELLDKIDVEADAIATKGFHQALARLLADPHRHDRFEAFAYELWGVEPPDYFVLGDCGVIVGVQTGSGVWHWAT